MLCAIQPPSVQNWSCGRLNNRCLWTQNVMPYVVLQEAWVLRPSLDVIVVIEEISTVGLSRCAVLLSRGSSFTPTLSCWICSKLKSFGKMFYNNV